MKLGYIGTSDITTQCLKASQLCPTIESVALLSRSPEKAHPLAKQFNIPHIVSSVEELAATNIAIDAVYIASPNAIHYPQAHYLLQQGKHLLIEKPFTISLEETKKITQLAYSQQKVVLEAVKHIHSPNFLVLKNLLPEIGSIHHAEFTFGKISSKWNSFQQGEHPNIFSKEMGGGSLMDIGIYCVWLMISLLGMPSKVSHSASLLSTGVDSQGRLSCFYPSFDVIINHSKIADIGSSFFIDGELGTLSGNDLSNMDSIYFTPKNGQKKDLSVPQDSNRMVYELQHFADHASNNTPIPDYYGLKITEQCAEVLTSARYSAGIFFDGEP